MGRKAGSYTAVPRLRADLQQIVQDAQSVVYDPQAQQFFHLDRDNTVLFALWRNQAFAQPEHGLQKNIAQYAIQELHVQRFLQLANRYGWLQGRKGRVKAPCRDS
ncbi:MAG: hypothetical protein ACRCWF_15095 [Beijerinckiaceae bacterium]